MQQPEAIELGQVMLEVGAEGTLWSLAHRDEQEVQSRVEAPAFEVNGEERGNFTYAGRTGERALPRGGREVTLRYVADGSPALQLLVTLRGYPDSPLIRFRYRLSAAAPTALTKHTGRDQIRYFTLRADDLAGMNLTEIQLSHFDPVAHSYLPNVEEL